MKDSELVESFVSSEDIFDGVIVHLKRDTVTLPNGKTATREVIRHPGAVCIVPLLDDGTVILERQYRYPYARIMLEIPAGKLDPGEEPEAAAIRELEEETGYRAGNLEYLGDMIPSPAILDELIHIYAATDLTEGKTHLDSDEFLEIIKLPLAKVLEMIMSNEIADAKTQLAVLKYAAKRNNEKA